jgi:thiol-disulfide isomerase/thioredoxin
MTGIREGPTKSPSGRGPWTYAPWAGALTGAAVVLYIIVAVVKPGGQGSLRSLAHGEMARLQVETTGAPEPATPFTDAKGRTVRLADLKAPVLVVNLWATWCAPCVREMPTLAKLQSAYQGRVVVAAISMDKAEFRERARGFIGEHPPLVFYQDANLALPFALSPAVEGFPSTIIYDRTGRERARLAGAADWSGPDAKAVIDALLAQP